jgi:hypothetical protein
MTTPAFAYRSVSIAVTIFALAGCSGSGLGSDSSSSSGSSNVDAQGIWVGTDSESGSQLVGIIDSAGAADFIRIADNTQYAGTINVSGSALTIPLNVNAQLGTHFPDNAISGTGTLSATVVTATSLNGPLTFTTSANSSINSTWSLTFSTLYKNASSLSAISGNYADDSTGDPLTGTTLSISGSGVVNGQSASTGCVLNGQLTVPNTSYNAYAVSYTLENCTGSYTVLNGGTFNGLAIISDFTSPRQVTIGVRGQNSSGTSFGIVSQLTLN